MDTERWLQIKTIVADALDRSTNEREGFLAAACADDEDLRLEVGSLLASHDRASHFIERPAGIPLDALDATHTAFVTGARVGPYRLLRLIGAGGMGTVYLAERADEAFEKQVAIKIAGSALVHPHLVDRFLTERRILATLDHPNITRLLDAGTIDDGSPEGGLGARVPYVVMEYVEGEPIDVHGRRLPIRARLELFRIVCGAVHYAHQRLVIHRDIKAGNVLVGRDGQPKLLDFGIAKLLESEAERGDRTQTIVRAMTPESASPEQLKDEPLTVATDVYSLGVLLYMLLTDRKPFDGATMTPPDLVRAICDTDPLPPSRVLDAGPSRVDRELDWITMRALRKEPSRRYGSAQQFAEDIERYLAGRPVLAAPDTWAYRTRKLLVRHRVAVAAGVLLAASLSLGAATTLWQARRANEQRAIAEQRLRETRRLVDAMVFDVNDALAAGRTYARVLLLSRASEQLDAIAAGATDDRVLAEEIATTYHRLGDVMGGQAGTASVGDSATGLLHHRKGLAIRQAQVALAPGDWEARLRLVTSLISTAYAEDEIEPSFQHARAAVEQAEEVLDAQPQEPRVRYQLARAHYALGSQYRAIGDTSRALDSFERAAPLFEEVHRLRPDLNVRQELAQCYKRLGAILVDQERFSEALTHLRAAVELDTTNLAESPEAPDRRRSLSISHTQMGWALLNAGDPRSALSSFRQALTLREALLKEDPTNVQVFRDVASALWYIGRAETASRDLQDAITTFQRAIPLAARSKDVDLSATIAAGLADAYEMSGRVRDALASRREALDLRRSMLAARSVPGNLRWAAAQDALRLGTTLMRLADAERPQRAESLRSACAAFEEGIRTVPSEDRPMPSKAWVATELRSGLDRCASVQAGMNEGAVGKR